MNYSTILYYVLRIPAVLIALTFHECAHGWMSYKLGDPTAKNLGRLTLNPIKHIDPIGFLMMIVVGFGYAKPVPINSRYYSKPKRDMALTAAAGPVMNIILAILSVLIFNLFAMAAPDKYEETPVVLLCAMLFFVITAQLNLFLALFNLIPVPPLDGSRIAYIFLPTKWYFGLMRYERYIMIGFMALVIILHRVFGISIISGVSMFFLGNLEVLISKIPAFSKGLYYFVSIIYLGI